MVWINHCSSTCSSWLFALFHCATKSIVSFPALSLVMDGCALWPLPTECNSCQKLCMVSVLSSTKPLTILFESLVQLTAYGSMRLSMLPRLYFPLTLTLLINGWYSFWAVQFSPVSCEYRLFSYLHITMRQVSQGSCFTLIYLLKISAADSLEGVWGRGVLCWVLGAGSGHFLWRQLLGAGSTRLQAHPVKMTAGHYN